MSPNINGLRSLFSEIINSKARKMLKCLRKGNLNVQNEEFFLFFQMTIAMEWLVRLKKFLKILLAQLWALHGKKSKKIEKWILNFLVQKCQTLDPYRCLSVWARIPQIHIFWPDFVGLHCVWIWRKSDENLWRYPDKTCKSGFLATFRDLWPWR